MGHRIGEGFQFLVGGFQLGRTFSYTMLQFFINFLISISAPCVRSLPLQFGHRQLQFHGTLSHPQFQLASQAQGFCYLAFMIKASTVFCIQTTQLSRKTTRRIKKFQTT